MSRRDFEACTPDEFHRIWKTWVEIEQRHERAAWERTRLQCMCMLQPYSGKRTLQPGDIMKFPWDNESEDPAASPQRPVLTREQEMEAYRQAKAAAGLK